LLLRRSLSARRACAAASLIAFAALATACGILPHAGRPAFNYTYGSNEPLRIAIIDETGGDDWSPAIEASVQQYGAGSAYLAFQHDAADANIVMTFHRYSDSQPPELQGYLFPLGAGGFATVYDPQGLACNFPPSPLPVGCSGELARADIYLNDIIPAGADIEARRERLILHEMGHAMGLERHSPDLDIAHLAERYGWDQ
jgi:hypothetical protein